jgi:hypothetical protein
MSATSSTPCHSGGLWDDALDVVVPANGSGGDGEVVQRSYRFPLRVRSPAGAHASARRLAPSPTQGGAAGLGAHSYAVRTLGLT